MSHYADFQPDVRFLPTFAVSPEGRRMAYVDDHIGHFNLTVRSIDGGEVRRLTEYTEAAVRRVAWHPDGRSMVFTADAQGDEKTQVYRIAAAGGEPEALVATPDAQHALAMGDPFSPDGTLLAYVANDRDPRDQDVLVHNMLTGVSSRVYAAGGRMQAGHWSPDGSRLTVVEWRTTNTDHVVHIVCPQDGTSVRVTPEDQASAYWLGPWLPDGSGFFVLTDVGREYVGLAVMDAATGELTWWDTPDGNVEEVALSADGRTVVWNVMRNTMALLRGRDVTTGQDLAMPALPMGNATGLTLTPDGRQALLRFSTPTRPWNVATIHLATGDLQWLTDAKPVAADPATFRQPKFIRYPTRGAHRVPAFLHRPTDTDEPVGVLLSIHGGPDWYETPTYVYDGFYQYLLSHNIAILAPNARGSLGYGKAYTEVLRRDWGGVDLEDFADAVAYLRTLGWVDPKRIGVFGASYGGFAVLSCLSRLPELDWAAGVDFYGISNLYSLAKSSPPTWRKLIEATFGDPDKDADRLLSRSPVTHADNIKAPLMVVQGANDPRVPPAESEQIVQRLRGRGVEVRYDVFPDEGHGFAKRENQKKAFAAAGEFLVRHLTVS